MTEIQGDILEIKEGIVFHQVNCMGVTGGLAGALRRKWPAAFTGYSDICQRMKSESISSVALVGETGVPGLLIAHIFGQEFPGPNTDMQMVDDSLRMAASVLGQAIQVPTYFPYKMGCGLGGGNWDEYRAVIEKYFPNAIIVRKPGYD